MEKYIELIILIHAGFGGLALIAGGFALSSKKGRTVHKNSGKVFYFAMLSSVILSLIIAIMPGHKSAFLFTIGIFSSYFILIGRRALNYRNQSAKVIFDKCLIIAMVMTGTSMITYPIFIHSKLNIVLTVFGSTGILLGIRDWRMISDPVQRKNSWLLIHATRITGGYIAAITAFLVVNDALPGIWSWLIPGTLGACYIYFWVRKLTHNSSFSKALKKIIG